MDETELVNTGDHPALNLLNTRCRPRGVPLELLESGRTFLDWMVSTELLDPAERRRIARSHPAADLDAAAAAARELREWLRPVVASWAAGEPITAAARRRLNTLLATDTQHLELTADGEGGLELRSRRSWDDAAQLVVPLAAAAADLLAHGDRELVRECDGPRCTLWFYDRTKSHRRRWCSQAVCGNRDKVRNHRARQAVG